MPSVESPANLPPRVQRERTRQAWRWFIPWKRSLGTWGFVLNRVAGLGLLLYLVIHLIVLRQLADGPAAWDSFVVLSKTPIFHLLDIILIAGILGHGLNGLRVAVIGTGFLVRWQRPLMLGLAALAVILLVIGAYLVMTK